jgi:hypothetical protein
VEVTVIQGWVRSDVNSPDQGRPASAPEQDRRNIGCRGGSLNGFPDAGSQRPWLAGDAGTGPLRRAGDGTEDFHRLGLKSDGLASEGKGAKTLFSI